MQEIGLFCFICKICNIYRISLDIEHCLSERAKPAAFVATSKQLIHARQHCLSTLCLLYKSDSHRGLGATHTTHLFFGVLISLNFSNKDILAKQIIVFCFIWVFLFYFHLVVQIWVWSCFSSCLNMAKHPSHLRALLPIFERDRTVLILQNPEPSLRKKI